MINVDVQTWNKIYIYSLLKKEVDVFIVQNCYLLIRQYILQLTIIE